jgi:hypothetical protein
MFEFEFSFSPLWLLLILPASAGLAWLTYRNARTRFTTPVWYTLIGIRALILAILLTFLLEPVIRSEEKIRNLPVIAWLHDASESMMATEDSSRIQSLLPEKFKAFNQNIPKEEGSLQAFNFGEGITGNFNPDSLKYNRGETDLSAALKDISERFNGRRLAAIVLFSDGITTAGDNPIYMLDRLGAPVYTVLAGDTIPRKDIGIGDIQVNEIAYIGSEVPVRILLRSTGYNGEETEVKLLHKGKILDARTVKLRSDLPEQELFFSVKPLEAGQQAYEFQAKALPGEKILQNNVARFYLKVLENRMRIAVFAGGPHPDLGAIQRGLTRFDQYQSEVFKRKTKSSFYLNPDTKTLQDYDLFVFHNFPSGPQDKEWLNQILDRVEKANVPLLFIAGTQTDLRTDERLLKYLGVVPAAWSEQTSEALTYIDPAYHNHATWTFDSKWDEWLGHAPPLIRNNSDWQPKSNTRVYGKAIVKSVKLQFPVFAFQEQLGRKNMVIIGENIWRWRTHAYLETQSFDAFDIWLGNCLQWLTTREDKRKFKVYPVKPLFTATDRILIRGEVYDDTYQPLSGAEIQLKLKPESGEEQTFYLSENADKQYSLELFGLKEGAYAFSAQTTLKDNTVLKDQGQFSVGKSDIEFLRLTADAGLMRQLAERSGGEVVRLEDLPDLSEKLLNLETMKTVVDYRINALDLNRLLWPMLFIFLLFTLEWVIRKWNGVT